MIFRCYLKCSRHFSKILITQKAALERTLDNQLFALLSRRCGPITMKQLNSWLI